MKVCFIAGFIAAFPAISFFFGAFYVRRYIRMSEKAFCLTYLLSLLLFYPRCLFCLFCSTGAYDQLFVTTGEGTAVPMLTISKYVEFFNEFYHSFRLGVSLPMVVLALTKVGAFSK